MPPPPRNTTAGRSLRSVPPVPVAREPEPRAPVARPARPVPTVSAAAPLALALWPAAVTLVVTLVRLVGERRGWSPDYFSTLPGGGLAYVGIAWLVPFVGAYFGWELARARAETPGLAGLVGWNLAALAIGLGIGYGLQKAVNPSPTRTMVLWAVVSLVASAMSLSTWPALGKLLLVYAAAARVPVLLVMALAIRGRWGTHYDALQPGFPLLSGPGRWLWTGLVPQMTVWVAFTLAVGAAFSAVGVLVASRQPR